MADFLEALRTAVGESHVWSGDAIRADYTHDEAITAGPVTPLAVVLPGSTAEVAAVLRAASTHHIPVIARGSGTGRSGGCQPVAPGIVIAFDHAGDQGDRPRQPGRRGGARRDPRGPQRRPGAISIRGARRDSASIGNVATNAGGMRAVRWQPEARHHVLGLEVVLADGTVTRTGGKFVKCSSGYDLTQLLIGSEGTLAVTTEITVKIQPAWPKRPPSWRPSPTNT